MKYDFLKSVSLLAFFATFTAVMFACNEGSDPSAPEITPQKSSSSMAGQPVSLAQETEVSPIQFQTPTVDATPDKTTFNFIGSATLNAFDTTANVDSDKDPVFTNLELVLAHINDLGQPETALISLSYKMPAFPVPNVNFGEMGLSIVDLERSQCGTFQLYITLYATNDEANPFKFITRDTVEFVREPEYCIEPVLESSSSEEVVVSDVPLTKHTADLTTDSNKGFSLKTDSEVPKEQADFQLRLNDENQLTLVGLNGFKVAKYTNDKDSQYDDDWYSELLPPEPVNITAFRFSTTKLAESIEGFDVDAFWVVVGPSFSPETGNDFAAVSLLQKGIANPNGVVPLSIIYYKK